MKCFYYSRYRFYKPNVKHEPCFFLISDVHFSSKIRSSRLDAITMQARRFAPDYILIAGDIVDSLDEIDTDTKLKRLLAWLENLGTVAPVIAILGNHDFYLKNPDHTNIFSKKRHWFSEKQHSFIQAVNDLPNVTLLDNSVYEDHNVYIFGYTQTPEYYQFDRDEERTTSIFHPGNEDKDILLSDLKTINPKLIHNLPAHKAKIALAHSPVHINHPDIQPFFADFDFVICGHMHSGAVPPVLNDFWRSDRGLMAPGKLFFPPNSRAHITKPDQKVITCGAISTIQKSAKPLTFLNSVFPVNIATLEFSHRETYAKKPDVKHQYISFNQ